jgi:prevent-host-death family protein
MVCDEPDALVQPPGSGNSGTLGRRFKCSVSSRKPTRIHGSNRWDKVMKTVPLSEVKDDLSKFLRIAETEEIVITRHGKPAGVLIGFGSEDDWFEYRLMHDPRFLRRIEAARQAVREGRGVRLEDVED